MDQNPLPCLPVSGDLSGSNIIFGGLLNLIKKTSDIVESSFS